MMQKPIGQGHSCDHNQWGIDPKLDRRLLDWEHNMKTKPISAAFGWPGMEPRWQDGVGTAYAASSLIWFTFWNGIITEVYYPTVDRPQLRDLEYLITDGNSFFHEEKRHLKSKFERLPGHALGYRCTNSDPDGRYSIVKEIITDPHLACVLQRTKLTGDESFRLVGSDLRTWHRFCAERAI
jgi:hypothetical protein